MLVFLLSFYLYYDLFNCDETVNEKFNESLLIDKHHQNLLHINGFLKDFRKKLHEKSVLIEGDYKNDSRRDVEFVYDDITNWRRSTAPGIDQTHQIPNANKKKPAIFHPSPQYNHSDHRQGLLHWLPPLFPGFKVPFPALVIPRPASPLLPLFNPRQRPRLPYPGYLLRPVHSMYPIQPPRFLSDYRYQNIYLRPPAPYMPSPFYTPGPNRPKRLPFIYAVNHYLQNNPHLLNPVLPAISPPFSYPASPATPQPVTISSSTIWTMGHNAKIWLQQIAPYTPINENTKNLLKDQSTPDRSENTAVPFNQDEHGFLNVSLPKKDEIEVQTNDPDENWMSTMAGDVLHAKVTVAKPSSTPFPKQRYLDLMKQLNEGYMMAFMLEVCRMIAVKDRREVRDVLYYSDMVYKSLWDTGQLAWIGDPLETVIWKLSIIKSGKDIDRVRTYASIMFHMLLQRKQTLSAEVNSIIDEAGLFYNHDEGDRLLHSSKQFDYPKITKNSYWLCDSLIKSFLVPFRRQSGASRRERLIDSINKGLKERFPLLKREHNEGTLDGKASSKKGSRFRKRKTKRHHLPHKKNRERKRQRILDYNNKNIHAKQYIQDIGYKESNLRTTIPVTSHQPRFPGVTKKSFITNNRRTTAAYLNLVTRSNRNRKPSHPKIISPFQEKLDSLDRKIYKSHFSRKTSTTGHRPPRGVATSTGPVFLASSGFHSPSCSERVRKDKMPFYQMKDRSKKDKRLKLKAELLLKITGSSSYSDEEVSYR